MEGIGKRIEKNLQDSGNSEDVKDNIKDWHFAWIGTPLTNVPTSTHIGCDESCGKLIRGRQWITRTSAVAKPSHSRQDL
ncbi:hypothetical protein L3Y34_002087 [Caenorhabditis briggsae]|uniref:Uncharacterized protein n=1 Tax=Caenorhabditis briggsae TaxID=6238 RepID=A0AAE9DDU6_CAEBR|nr:hypothetical protein L3Y34_002087 [Caenorhabditis briggsae]